MAKSQKNGVAWQWRYLDIKIDSKEVQRSKQPVPAAAAASEESSNKSDITKCSSGLLVSLMITVTVIMIQERHIYQ